jgi:hypothetical protein
MTSRPPTRSSAPPTSNALREVARFRGLAFSDEQIDRAVDAYIAFWPKLLRLRAIRLPYPPPTVTPADAFSWIEHSVEASNDGAH